MTEEKIPPLPKLEISDISKDYIDQETMDQAMQYIYTHRPDFFKRSYERDISWEADPTQDEEAWVHDEFSKDLHNFIRHVAAKTIGIPDDINLTSIQGRIFAHLQKTARTMYGMPQIGEKTSKTR